MTSSSILSHSFGSSRSSGTEKFNKDPWHASQMTMDQMRLIFGDKNIIYENLPGTKHPELNPGKTPADTLKIILDDMKEADINVRSSSISQDFIEQFENSFNESQKKKNDEVCSFISALAEVAQYDGSKEVRGKLKKFLEETGFNSTEIDLQIAGLFYSVLLNEEEVTERQLDPNKLHRAWVEFSKTLLTGCCGSTDASGEFCYIRSSGDACFSFDVALPYYEHKERKEVYKTIKTNPDAMMFLKSSQQEDVFPLIVLQIKTSTKLEAKKTSRDSSSQGSVDENLDTSMQSGKRPLPWTDSSPADVKKLHVCTDKICTSESLSPFGGESQSSALSSPDMSPLIGQFDPADISPSTSRQGSPSLLRHAQRKGTGRTERLDKMKTQHFMELIGPMKDRSREEYRRPSKTYGIYIDMGYIYVTCLKIRNGDTISPVLRDFLILSRDQITRSPHEWQMISSKPLNLFDPAHCRAFLWFVRIIINDKKRIHYFNSF